MFGIHVFYKKGLLLLNKIACLQALRMIGRDTYCTSIPCDRMKFFSLEYTSVEMSREKNIETNFEGRRV
jgi:hypothetical protein